MGKTTQEQNAEHNRQQGTNFCSDPHALAEAHSLIHGDYLSASKLLLNVILTVIVCETSIDLVVTSLHITPPLDTVLDSLGVALLVIPLFYYQIAKPYLLQLRRSLEMGKALLEVNGQLCQMAITDELTGLYNRRGFFELARHQFNVSKRYGRPLALLFCDLDGLKQINDTHGHDAGDQAIKDTARALTQGLRASDVAARMGGDEFAVLLPQSGEPAAKIIAARVESALQEINRGRKPAISLSIGVRELDPAAMRGMDDLLALADADMYRTKAEKKASGQIRQPGPNNS
ncbi:MAG TPA: GGDEF domain-containing protein [Elusimicrobiales bacterium]|nr:GGDEF domain-containing protein [Elusimicrobiales bacterium]